MTEQSPAESSSAPTSTAQQILSKAVQAVGGQARAGQQQMADAVAAGLRNRVHMLIQAGTGTGKSMGYLAPALAWAIEHERTVVVATATLALQNQLAKKDVPVIQRALAEVLGTQAKVEIAKGRSNYACLLKAREQVVEQDGLFEEPSALDLPADPNSGGKSELGSEVLALRDWIDEQSEQGGSADRDDAPAHSPRAWAQVSVSARECLGASNCRYGHECFAELAKAKARAADLVITNHSLLAIDALMENGSLPEHDAVIIDEAHELTDRVTGAASAELSAPQLLRAARRAAAWLSEQQIQQFEDAIADFGEAIDASSLGRLTAPDEPVVLACAALRGISRNLVSSLNSGAKTDADRSLAAAELGEITDICQRVAALKQHDVVWISQRETAARQLHVAPLSVAGLLRETVLAQRPVVMTSATLKLGDSFTSAAGSVGLRQADALPDLVAVQDSHDQRLAETEPDDEPLQRWCALDVGSPFDYRNQGICYIAADLPNPSREGIAEQALERIVELITASHGHALGLFASQRAAQTAAAHVRAALPELTVLCQGERQLAELTRRFVTESDSCLFGTLSLWQGLDAPGQSCRLVIIDKIPFPRPDEPLLQARQQRVAEQGGNGFMQVAATHAALLLAQGAGRLIRRADDRGVVAVLDPRLTTARYGKFLLSSMPDFWLTTDLPVALGALERLGEQD